MGGGGGDCVPFKPFKGTILLFHVASYRTNIRLSFLSLFVLIFITISIKKIKKRPYISYFHSFFFQYL